ncbi:MAG TPA: hypothetical protein VK929_06935 [Longimicrobiales bacterium]|nr:hypothetical protein [Longimicrobiales bacterium]
MNSSLTEQARCLTHRVASLTGDPAMERRHEELMEWAEAELGMDREYAEQMYALAEEEQLPPVYALLLVHCGIGVQELEEPEQDADEAAHQAAPPEWVETERVELEDVAMERRLRTTFRRFRGQMESAGTPAAAVAAFLAETDVGPVRLR